MDSPERELQKLVRWKTRSVYKPDHLGDAAIELFNTDIRKRQQRFGKLSEVWDQLVPAGLSEHAYLGSFTRGILVVLVDSSAHLFELKQLMLAGLEDQLLIAGRSAGLKKITLKRGTVPG
jgi:hypothetical protein